MPVSFIAAGVFRHRWVCWGAGGIFKDLQAAPAHELGVLVGWSATGCSASAFATQKMLPTAPSVHAAPHMGSAYTSIATDVIARFQVIAAWGMGWLPGGAGSALGMSVQFLLVLNPKTA